MSNLFWLHDEQMAPRVDNRFGHTVDIFEADGDLTAI